MQLTAQQQAHACVSLGYREDEILALLRDDYQLDEQAAAAVLAAAKDSVLGQEVELYEAEQQQEDR
jgi:hypothetical protein